MVMPHMTPDANGEIDPGEGPAPCHGESMSAQTQADAEELLSRARAQAELLRVHAEAARAEAESLRAEAAALRRAARDEAAAAGARAEAVIAQLHASAEAFRSAMEVEADAARSEVERSKTEAASLRHLLQADIDTGLEETEQMRSQLQALWAETGKLAAQLRLLSDRAEAAGAPDGPGSDPSRAAADTQVMGPVAEPGRQANGRQDELHRAMVVGVEQRVADTSRRTEGSLAMVGENRRPIHGRNGRETAWLPSAGETAAASTPAGLPHVAEAEADRPTDPVLPQLDVGKLLREIWDAAYMESTRLSERGFPAGPPMQQGDESPEGGGQAFTDLPVGGDPGRPKASEPLIGSGGWRASTARTSPDVSVDAPVDRQSISPPEEPGRPGRGFRRRK